MSAYNPETTRTASAQSPAPDTQTLIGLLDGLMPMLLQLQSQYPGQGYFGHPGPSDFGVGLGNVTPPNPMLDHQAASEMIEDINASALRTLSTYLENYANQRAGLANAVPLVTQAARCFAMRDQAQAFALIWQAYRAITIARAMDPQLPPPRVAVSGPTSSASVLH
ncbi:MAG: hypothetical protein ABSG88_14620 [Bradyrhizobium sp.]